MNPQFPIPEDQLKKRICDGFIDVLAKMPVNQTHNLNCQYVDQGKEDVIFTDRLFYTCSVTLMEDGRKWYEIVLEGHILGATDPLDIAIVLTERLCALPKNKKPKVENGRVQLGNTVNRYKQTVEEINNNLQWEKFKRALLEWPKKTTKGSKSCGQ